MHMCVIAMHMQCTTAPNSGTHEVVTRSSENRDWDWRRWLISISVSIQRSQWGMGLLKPCIKPWVDNRDLVSVYAFRPQTLRVLRRSCFVQRKLLGDGGLLTASSGDGKRAVLSGWPPHGVAMSKHEGALLCNTRHVQTVAHDAAPREPSLQLDYLLYCTIAGCTHSFACKQNN